MNCLLYVLKVEKQCGLHEIGALFFFGVMFDSRVGIFF